MADKEIELLSAQCELAMDIPIDAQDIVKALKRDPDCIFRFIKELDEEAEDWDLTLSLAEHFAALRAVHERETQEIQAQAEEKE